MLIGMIRSCHVLLTFDATLALSFHRADNIDFHFEYIQALEIQLHSAQAIEFLGQLPLEPHVTREFFHCSYIASNLHRFRFKNHEHLNSQ